VFRGERRVAGRTEAEVFRAAGLPFIEPELREGTGEIEAAARRALPKLVTPGDIRGDLHCHTDASDGHDSLAAMAAAAKALGYEYLAVSDHSRRVTVAHGLDAGRLLAQVKAIDKLNGKLRGITLLKSCEVDILADGRLDLPDSVLKELDFTVCSVHYQTHLPAKKQTERILRAMDNRYFTILGHPTGRLINERPAYEVDLGKIIAGAKARGCFLEVNAHPDRLDLDDRGCRAARDAGVKLSIATDAHSGRDLALMRFGVDQARRGWLEPRDVLNTRPLAELRRLLRR
jgi:DNA polymerase (family 10)